MYKSERDGEVTRDNEIKYSLHQNCGKSSQSIDSSNKAED